MIPENWIVTIIAGFLGISLFLYCLLGGADFGAGILEIFLGPHRKADKQALITKALGPVWEANHIWLILVVVILFNGFPMVFFKLCVHLHIPLTLLLFGIIFRGCAFTFRHYDVGTERVHRYYSTMFAFASLLSPLFLGIIAGSMISGKIPAHHASYAVSYVYPWLDFFPLCLGIFACCLFSFVSAVYLTGESNDEELKESFVRATKWAGTSSMISGAMVFLSAFWTQAPWFFKFLQNRVGLLCVLVATVLFLILQWKIKRMRPWHARILIGLQMALIFIGWFVAQFPILLHMDHEVLDMYRSAAPKETLTPLLWALLLGSVIIFPSLGYVLKVFKSTKR